MTKTTTTSSSHFKVWVEKWSKRLYIIIQSNRTTDNHQKEELNRYYKTFKTTIKVLLILCFGQIQLCKRQIYCTHLLYKIKIRMGKKLKLILIIFKINRKRRPALIYHNYQEYQFVQLVVFLLQILHNKVKN